MADKIVLAYSGGLDTSVAIRWLQEQYGVDIATLTMDLGGQVDLEGARQRALDIGAIRADVMDAREEFVRDFVWPALRAGAIYEGVYPLATALGRPLIAKHLVRIALEEGASGIAHGCTGKGERPGAVRRQRGGARARAQGRRARPRVGHDPRR